MWWSGVGELIRLGGRSVAVVMWYSKSAVFNLLRDGRIERSGGAQLTMLAASISRTLDCRVEQSVDVVD